MADNLTKTITKARALAVCHVIVGFLLVCFGVADYVAGTWTGIIGMGIWTGIWVSRISNSSNADFCCLPEDAKVFKGHSLRKKINFTFNVALSV